MTAYTTVSSRPVLALRSCAISPGSGQPLRRAAHIASWRSVRANGDAERRSRGGRSSWQPVASRRSGSTGSCPSTVPEASQLREDDLVFLSSAGTALDPANVRRDFRRVLAGAGLEAMSGLFASSATASSPCSPAQGVPVEDIAHLVGHANTRVIKFVYRDHAPVHLVRLFDRLSDGWQESAAVLRYTDPRTPWRAARSASS